MTIDYDYIAEQAADAIDMDSTSIEDILNDIEFDSISGLSLNSFEWNAGAAAWDIDTDGADLEGLSFGMYDNYSIVDMDTIRDNVSTVLRDAIADESEKFSEEQYRKIHKAIIKTLKKSITIVSQGDDKPAVYDPTFIAVDIIDRLGGIESIHDSLPADDTTEMNIADLAAASAD